ncbi:MAG: hypothetical protein OEZ02_00995 [Anaerolineae bacterium]|nr:hypothetical protein [Anaerolineae bacterium]
MLKNFVNLFGGDPNKRAIQENIELVDQINALEDSFESLTDEQLAAKTDEFRSRLAAGETLDDLLIEAFATVREVSKRALGMRHYDVQLIGGIVLHKGQIAEMRTGEGKTLMATLPLYLNALEGHGAHLITVNDYLARRDARWMAPVFNMLGLSVGVLQMAARTEHGKKAFMVNLEKESGSEDQHQLEMVLRKAAYAADITYGTNNEFGFDYLRDNMAMSLESRSQRGHHFAIIDEVDNVLIDEARTPLIISGPSHDDTENYQQFANVVKQLKPADYEIIERDRTATLTELGESTVERILGVPLRDPERPEDITPEQARMLGFLEQAMRAQFLFKRNKQYLIQAGKVVIIDEYTGRLMPGRRWSDGLHQAVEAKEGVRIEPENVTYATITIQNYFRMYQKLAGMTGTALTEAEEFSKIYDLEVLAIPPNVDYHASRQDATLVEKQDQDEYGYKYTYYALSDDPTGAPAFWRRKDYPDVVYRTEEAKTRALIQEIIQYHVIGRPILVGTTSVENSERLSARMRAEPVRRLLQTLLLRHVWMKANNRVEDGRMIMALSYLNEPLEKLVVSDMRKMANKLEISLNLEDDKILPILLEILDLSSEHAARLSMVAKGGIAHKVLNARKHTEESQIIAGAGAFGAVTIATNMAGRGVDIKLGGEIAEEILTVVNRVLARAGLEDAYELSLEEQKEALQKLDPADFGIYDAEIKFFLQSMDDMVKVKKLGGLHVVGSERHNARRIDNQLRGRAARQGDPGSSRFYLSMEDELMRLFGGQQVDALMQRMRIDDAMPLEANLVSKMIEQSQTRVEGANFDTRKHVLEYDDVLNAQRTTIYDQRDRIFVKEDLTDDILEMLQAEISERVPAALMDEEGPWKLLAWLEQVQPTFARGSILFPSFTYKLLIDHAIAQQVKTPQAAFDMMLAIAEKSLEAQEDHFLNSVNNLLNSMEDYLKQQLKERIDSADTFFQGLSYSDETDTRSPAELLDELSGLLRFPVKLSNAEVRLLRDAPNEVADLVEDQIEQFMTSQTITRLLGSVERRLEESLDLNAAELAKENWETVAEKVLRAVEDDFAKSRSRLIGDQQDGQIAKDIQSQLAKVNGEINDGHVLGLLLMMPQGTRAAFDKKTHKRVLHKTTRLSYAYFAATLIADLTPEEITDQVLDHFDRALDAMQKAWGVNEWTRVKDASISDLNERTRSKFAEILGEQTINTIGSRPLETVGEQQRRELISALGSMTLTEIYRELLLRVISELWVDYLTRIEALRISIGLEAYAQRDPLVQYKSQAFQMFQNLFVDMRMGVVSRMFTFQPRGLSVSQPNAAEPDAPAPEEQAASPAPNATPGAAESSGKRKRRRRKK